MKAVPDKRFLSLLVGGFVLEMAGYLAFPYIGLRLREQFHVPEARIGAIMMIALLLRIVWSLLGGVLAERTRPFLVFVVACLSESVCFFILGLATSWQLAAFAVVLGNMGFSLWSPNLFALVYKWYGEKGSANRVSLLNGAVNAGAAMGCVLGAITAQFDVFAIFTGTGILYLLCIPLLGASLWKESPHVTKNFEKRPLAFAPWKIFPLVLVALGFWASYSQFNAFFSLFAHDWLHNDMVTGFAFGGVAMGVAAFSFCLSRFRDLEAQLGRYCLVSALLLVSGWFTLSSATLAGTAYFVLVLAIAEATFATFLAHAWAKYSPSHEHLMQSANFSVRNTAMGIGSAVGGMYYVAPGMQTLLPWTLQNGLWILLAIFALLLGARSLR